MPCTLLDPATARAMPWKNGGGSTVELAISPADAGLEDFAWRISTAQVAVDGAFSSFPGIDRSLAVLAGNGVCLQRADGQRETLLSGGAIAVFGGEEAIRAVTRGPSSARGIRRIVLDAHRATSAKEVLLPSPFWRGVSPYASFDEISTSSLGNLCPIQCGPASRDVRAETQPRGRGVAHNSFGIRPISFGCGNDFAIGRRRRGD